MELGRGEYFGHGEVAPGLGLGVRHLQVPPSKLLSHFPSESPAEPQALKAVTLPASSTVGGIDGPTSISCFQTDTHSRGGQILFTFKEMN